MLVDPSTSTVGSTVAGAIRQASQATGTSFKYLLATAQVESGLNPAAGAPTSSARGLFQFIEQTWLGTIKQSGASLGYGKYADAITRTASGHYQVADPTMRNEILKLRNDPTANALMAGAFTKANADILSNKLGRAPSEGELYIAHFLGAGGAAKLISAAATDPNAKASAYFPNAASANSPIFFDRSTGAPRTLAQVRNILTARYDVARGRSDVPQMAQAAPAVGVPLSLAANIASVSGGRSAVSSVAGSPLGFAAQSAPARPVTDPLDLTALTKPRVASVSAKTPSAPDTAGITKAYAEAMTQVNPATVGPSGMFHGLFQDTDRTAPVAAVVSQLWTTPLAEPGKPGGPRDMTGLFKDDGEGT